MNCLWCEAEFAQRKSGGKAQRFCSSECRTAFHNAGHRWLLKAIDDGLVPVSAIRNGPTATLMLRGARSRPRPALGGPENPRRRPDGALRLEAVK